MVKLHGEPAHIKLYNLPQRVEGGIKIHGVKDLHGKDIVVLFHHLDGMYSVCTIQNPEAPNDTDGELISLSATTPLVEIGNNEYKIDDTEGPEK